LKIRAQPGFGKILSPRLTFPWSSAMLVNEQSQPGLGPANPDVHGDFVFLPNDNLASQPNYFAAYYRLQNPDRAAVSWLRSSKQVL
jgi:hypothetical protein